MDPTSSFRLKAAEVVSGLPVVASLYAARAQALVPDIDWNTHCKCGALCTVSSTLRTKRHKTLEKTCHACGNISKRSFSHGNASAFPSNRRRKASRTALEAEETFHTPTTFDELSPSAIAQDSLTNSVAKNPHPGQKKNAALLKHLLKSREKSGKGVQNQPAQASSGLAAFLSGLS